MTGSVDVDVDGVCGPTAGDGSPERGLFVIWPQARQDEREVLADLAARFRMVAVYEVRWTQALVRRNYERFYSDLAVRGVYHVINKGTGPFIAAAVIDPDAVHGRRPTSRGERTVNVNFLDAKLGFRDRRGKLGVHCSETAAETRRDLFMLLGADVCRLDRTASEPWDGRVEPIERDVVGTNGWSTESDLLQALDAATEYVMIGSPDDHSPLFGGPVVPELLTTDYHALHTVMNARPVLGHPPARGGRFTVEIGGRRVPVGIRSIDDGFVDPSWARRCLERRVLDGRGCHRPPEPDDLATWCYVAATRRPHLSEVDRRLLRRLAVDECDGGGLAPMQPIGRTEAVGVVERYMAARGYANVVPRDPTVWYHVEGGRRERSVRSGRRVLHRLTGAVGGFARARWLTVRDALVGRAPALRGVVRRWRGHS